MLTRVVTVEKPPAIYRPRESDDEIHESAAKEFERSSEYQARRHRQICEQRPVLCKFHNRIDDDRKTEEVEDNARQDGSDQITASIVLAFDKSRPHERGRVGDRKENAEEDQGERKMLRIRVSRHEPAAKNSPLKE